MRELRAWLDTIASRPMWRAVLAFINGVLTLVATTGGLFIFLPWAQSAVVSGMAVGLVAPRTRSASVVGSLVGLTGVLIGPRNFFGWYYYGSHPSATTGQAIIGSVVLCAATAAGVRLASHRYPKGKTLSLALALTMLIGNLWLTALTINATPGATVNAQGVALPSFNDQLAGNIPEDVAVTDSGLFFEVYQRASRGQGFYRAYDEVLTEARGGVSSVADFRFPMLFWLWGLLPSAQHIVLAFLVLATCAVFAVLPLTMDTARLPLTISGAAALSSYLLYFALNSELFRQEPWAGALGLLAVASYAVSARSAKWKLYASLAMMLAVLAVLTREIMAFLLLAHGVSALLGDKTQRRFRMTTFIVGLLAFAALYGAHALAVQPYTLEMSDLPRVGYGGVGFALAAFDFATTLLGRGTLLPAVLGILGTCGALMLRDPRLRALAVIAVLAPLAAFLVLGNNAWEINTGLTTNYWGAGIQPLLYALIPSAFALIPGAEVGESLSLPAENEEVEPS